MKELIELIKLSICLTLKEENLKRIQDIGDIQWAGKAVKIARNA